MYQPWYQGWYVNCSDRGEEGCSGWLLASVQIRPRLKAEGKNPFILDSKAPTADYKDFIMGEVRYNALARQNPERAEKLFGKAVQNAKDRYDYLLRYAKLYNTEEK